LSAVTVVVTAGFAILGATTDAESHPRLVEVLTFLIRRGLIAFGSTTLALRSRPLAIAVSSADELEFTFLLRSYDSKIARPDSTR